MKNKTYYRAISPCGFDCFMDERYATKAEAKAATKRFAANYRKQGYYSGNNGRLELHEIANNCRIVKQS